MRAKGTLPVSLLWKWLENHADVTDGDLGGWITKCSLTDMSRRPDGHVLLRILISKVDNLKLQDYLKCMLEAAVKDGSAETVEVYTWHCQSMQITVYYRKKLTHKKSAQIRQIL